MGRKGKQSRGGGKLSNRCKQPELGFADKTYSDRLLEAKERSLDWLRTHVECMARVLEDASIVNADQVLVIVDLRLMRGQKRIKDPRLLQVVQVNHALVFFDEAMNFPRWYGLQQMALINMSFERLLKCQHPRKTKYGNVMVICAFGDDPMVAFCNRIGIDSHVVGFEEHAMYPIPLCTLISESPLCGWSSDVHRVYPPGVQGLDVPRTVSTHAQEFREFMQQITLKAVRELDVLEQSTNNASIEQDPPVLICDGSPGELPLSASDSLADTTSKYGHTCDLPGCQIQGVLLKCSQCRSRRYCCAEHQIKHWKMEHRRECRPRAELVEALQQRVTDLLQQTYPALAPEVAMEKAVQFVATCKDTSLFEDPQVTREKVAALVALQLYPSLSKDILAKLVSESLGRIMFPNFGDAPEVKLEKARHLRRKICLTLKFDSLADVGERCMVWVMDKSEVRGLRDTAPKTLRAYFQRLLTLMSKLDPAREALLCLEGGRVENFSTVAFTEGIPQLPMEKVNQQMREQCRRGQSSSEFGYTVETNANCWQGRLLELPGCDMTFDFRLR